MTTNNGRKAYRAKWYQENKERVCVQNVIMPSDFLTMIQQFFKKQ